MKTFNLKSIYTVICIASVSLSSCAVDESYDLMGKIDTTIKVGQNYEIPLGDFEQLNLENVITDEAREILDKVPYGYVVDIPEDFDASDLSFAVASIHGIKDLALDDVTVEVVKFNVTVSSTLPVEFALSADAIGADGESVGQVGVETRARLTRADIDNPSGTDLVVTFKPKNGKIDFDGFDIVLKAVSLPENGTIILKDQGIDLKEGFLSFPEGLIIENL